MNQKNWFIAVMAVILATLLVSSPLTLLHVASPIRSAEAQQLSRAEKNWEYLNHDQFGTNYNPQNVINKDNVGALELKWIHPFPPNEVLALEGYVGFGGIGQGTSAAPLIIDGIIYVVLNSRSVMALDARDGEQLWFWANSYDSDAGELTKPIRGASGSHTHGMYWINGKLWINDFGCKVTALDARTGTVSAQIDNLCSELPLDSPLGKGVPGNSGWYSAQGSHPPVIYEGGNTLIWGVGGNGEGVHGGRMFVAGHDVESGDLLWRTFLMPPCGQTNPDPDKWFLNCEPAFRQEGREWGEMLVDSCDKIWIQGIKACDIDQNILRNDWDTYEKGTPHNAGISNIWGQMVVDEETGIIYFGTAQPGPDWNATYVPGPRLFGSSVMALNARTGDIIWAHQTTVRDLWDFDCSWNTILTETVVQGEEKKVVIKGCKNGNVYVLDAATGEAYHVFDAPTLRRCPQFCQLLDPLNPQDLLKPWTNYPETGPFFMNCPAWGCLESDIAFDSDRNMIFAATMNNPAWSQAQNNDGYIAIGALRSGHDFPAPFEPPFNHTVTAWDVNTGEVVWEFTLENFGYRGGTMATGGLVFPTPIDGIFRALDAETGEVLYEKSTGVQVINQATVGADADGRMLILRTIGGARTSGALMQNVGDTTPGAVMAFGLPDNYEEQLAAEEAEREEFQQEIEAERAALEEERAVFQASAGAISPISYVIIGVGVVLVVIAGVLFARRRST